MIVIPARLHSTRFPRKILAPIDGLPMVVKTARAVADVDEVVVAIDSEEVGAVCARYGIRTIMTSSQHQSGTDRINEAATRLGLDPHTIVINVQADEPFIEPDVVQTLINLVRRHAHEEETLACSLYKTIDAQAAHDPNLVKVVVNESDYALYFSRSPIPYNRDGQSLSYKGHLGLYGFVRHHLDCYCRLKPSNLESIEKLEQLRILAHGYKIAMACVQSRSIGIDTPQDLQRVASKQD